MSSSGKKSPWKFAPLTPRNNYTDNSAYTGKSSRDDLIRMGYTIGNLLGEGSYCKVKSATYKGKKIAVKIISRQNLSVDFETRFLPREIEVLSQIKHENICKIYRIFSYPNRVYIFMELIGKGDLLDYVRNRGRLTEEETCYFLSQMANAVQYLHSIQVAHRDLKCENIMLTDSDVIKIIDFGFCRHAVNDQGKRELSSTFCGSTAYAAPEVLQGIPYNPMMYDVWSMGCVLFIMITGTMPFDDSNVKKMVTYQLKRRYSYPKTFEINQEIKDLIYHMLEPDVTRRFSIARIAHNDWIQNNKGKFKETQNSEESAYEESTFSEESTSEESTEHSTGPSAVSSASTGTQTDGTGAWNLFGFGNRSKN